MTMQQDSDRALLAQAIQQHQNQPGALLPLLHAVQDALGYIPEWSVAEIAAALNQSRAEVHGVITFYHHFRTTAPTRHTLQICQAEACQSRGSRQLTAHAEHALGCSLHGRSQDQQVELQPVYCLGLCSSGPNIQLDDKLYARVDAAKLERILAKTKEARLASVCSCRAIPPHWRWAPTRPPRPSWPKRNAVALISSWSATARGGCSGSNRWSRCRRHKAASPTARSRPTTWRRCSTR
ncbi:MAG: formate dehydrogenase subunit gamma [Pseudogulbenkiania sp.]|nr:formate dehydrogenase subunit gamma [Pseudogulbenkiania sp.]